MEYILGAATIIVITFLAVLSPGPDFAVVVRNSLTRSRGAGIGTALGSALGNTLYVALALLGLVVFISSSIVIFTVLKYLGAVYLVYLGVTSLRSTSHRVGEIQATHVDSVPIVISIQEGFLTNLSNPKFIVFLLAVFSQVINPETPLVIQTLYGLIIPVVAFSWFSTLSFLITTPIVRTQISKILHRVEQVMGIFLIGLGAKIALESH